MLVTPLACPPGTQERCWPWPCATLVLSGELPGALVKIPCSLWLRSAATSIRADTKTFLRTAGRALLVQAQNALAAVPSSMSLLLQLKDGHRLQDSHFGRGF